MFKSSLQIKEMGNYQVIFDLELQPFDQFGVYPLQLHQLNDPDEENNTFELNEKNQSEEEPNDEAFEGEKCLKSLTFTKEKCTLDTCNSNLYNNHSKKSAFHSGEKRIDGKQINLLKSYEFNGTRQVNRNKEHFSLYLKKFGNSSLYSLMSKMNSKGKLNSKTELLNYIYGIPAYQGQREDSLQNKGKLSVRKILTMLSEKDAIDLKYRMGLLKINKTLFSNKEMLSEIALSKEFTIDNVLTKELQQSLDPSLILFSGELYRYHPGFSEHFVKKFCVLTRANFSYYRNPCSKRNNSQNPLVSIPINLIHSVSPVNVEILELRKNSNREKDKNFNPLETKYRFEIFLKENEKVKYVIINETFSYNNQSQILIQDEISFNNLNSEQKLESNSIISSIRIDQNIPQNGIQTLENKQNEDCKVKNEFTNVLVNSETKLENFLVSEYSKELHTIDEKTNEKIALQGNKEILKEMKTSNVIENASDNTKEEKSKKVDFSLRMRSDEQNNDKCLKRPSFVNDIHSQETHLMRSPFKNQVRESRIL